MRQEQARSGFDASWGADLEPGRRPGVPKERNRENGSSGHSSHWARIPRQKPAVKILQTVERPALTPVFGTKCPPRGLSGLLRELAFGYSEDKLRHWMLLVFADRVDMVEGWVEDLFRGKAPMILPRMEFRTLDQLRNPKTRGKGLASLAVAAGAAGLLAWALLPRAGARARARKAVAPSFKPPRDFKMWESSPDLP